SYFNWQGTQDDTASYLKPDREDKNVTPQQMVDYVNRFTSLKAIWRMAGSLDQIRWLIANRFVVIVESGYEPAGEGWFGHYETVIAYDTTVDTITVYDSYLGRDSRPTVTYPSAKFDSQWQSFNRNFIVIYVPERESELAAFLGSDWVESLNRQKAAQVAQREAASDPENPYAWSNLGTSLTSIGRYPEAVTAYQQALDLGLPYRFFWYQYGVFEALLQTSRLEDVLTLVNSTLKTTSYVEEMYYYLGRVYEIQGNYALAQTEYQEALQRNPNYELATIALRRIGGT
ncbi:MAG: tetratricopeptide repeat protein, partial [Anaerolineae bacterium]